ncbi:sigma-70 family RNA polymerase sigma factor [Methylopila sp. 73B]|uniref:RNA polymerase sigma factor n=1 Tax=Methylopila sp. 73B TaxID=1120792 RepID=UPI00037253A3|nr:sigma-70 family RNA polymerase sigma factor [Methylopila sp. 73B]
MPILTGSAPRLSDLDGADLLNRAIEDYYNELVAAAARRSGANAFDVVHDLYLKLAAQPDVLRDKRSLKVYLCRAAANLGIDRFRRERFEAALFSGGEHEASSVAEDASPERMLEVEARIAILRDAITELPARRRAVFILHRFHGLTADDIAARLNITRNMVDRHLRQALSHCLERLVAVEIELAVWSWSR